MFTLLNVNTPITIYFFIFLPLTLPSLPVPFPPVTVPSFPSRSLRRVACTILDHDRVFVTHFPKESVFSHFKY